MKFSKSNRPKDTAVKAQERQVYKERRNFLDMVGKAGIASSTLRFSSLLGGVMTARYAQAQSSPKRVVFCYVHSGAPENDFRPSSPTNMAYGTHHYGPASHNIAGVCKFRGVDTERSIHSQCRQALGALRFSANTIDVDLGSVLGATSFYSVVYLGSNATGSGTDSNVIASSSGLPIESPSAAVEQFFGVPPSAGPDNTYLKSFEAQKAAIESVKNKLSVEERERLNVHLNALEKLEARVTQLNSTEPPDFDSFKPDFSGDPNKSSNSGMVDHGKLQADIITAIFAADIARVATLQVGSHNGGGWTYQGFDGHNAGHSGGASIWNAMMREKFEIPAYFVKRLTETLDSNGKPLIESTAFCQVSCGGNGLSHSSQDAPFMLATKLPEFGGGQFSSKSTGATAQNFMSEIAEGLGVPPSSTELGDVGGADVDLLA